MADEARSLIPSTMTKYAQAANYSPGIAVGGLLFASGQVGRDESGHVPEDPEAQFVVAFENVLAVLAEGGAGFDDVVDLTTYHTDMKDLALFSKVKNRYLTAAPLPAWTGVGVSELALPGLRVEIRVIAAIPRG